jgi:uncharacterized protein with beta-barrel porin domain
MLADLPDAMARMGGWFRALGGFASLNGSAGAPGFDTQGGGFLAGIDRPVTDTLHPRPRRRLQPHQPLGA